MRLVALLLALAAFQPSGIGGGPDPVLQDEFVGKVNPGGKFVVLVLDISISMNENDPLRFNEQGGQLAVAMASSRDNLGAVTFGSDAAVLHQITQLSDRGERIKAQRRIADCDRKGQTNYTDALKLASTMLTRAKAPRESVVIFLTDGENNVGGSRETVLNQLTPFIANGWRVHCIGLGKEGVKSALLKEIALRTESAYFPVLKADELAAAFVKVLSQVFGLISIDGGFRAVETDESYRRMVYLASRAEKSGSTILGLTRDGSAVPMEAPQMYRYPERPDPRRQIEAVHVDQPPPGKWEIDVSGPLTSKQILYQPDLALTLDEGFPAAEYYEGEQIEFLLRVQGNEALMERVRKGGQVKVTITGEDGTPLGDLELTKTGENPVKFTGKMPVPAAKGMAQAVMKFTLTDESGATWTHEKRAAIRINEGTRPIQVEISPGALDLGTRWEGQEAGTGEITMTMKGKATADFSIVPNSDRLTVSPATARLGPGESAKIQVRAASTSAGTFSETITISGAQEGGTRVSAPPVTVTWKVVPFSGGGALPPVSVKQGEEFRIPLELGQGLEFSIDNPSGPSGPIPTTIVEDGGKKYLTGRVPADATSGDYKGTLKAGVPGSGLAPREIPFTVSVGAAVPTLKPGRPSVDVVATKPGWAEAEFSFDFDFPRGAQVSVKCAELSDGKGGKIDATYRQGFKAGEGWDGKAVPGKGTYGGRYRVNISNDLAPGKYTGKLTLRVSDGGRTFDTDVPLTVEYKPE